MADQSDARLEALKGLDMFSDDNLPLAKAFLRFAKKKDVDYTTATKFTVTDTNTGVVTSKVVSLAPELEEGVDVTADALEGHPVACNLMTDTNTIMGLMGGSLDPMTAMFSGMLMVDDLTAITMFIASFDFSMETFQAFLDQHGELFDGAKTAEDDAEKTEEGGEQTGPKKPSGTFAVFKQEGPMIEEDWKRLGAQCTLKTLQGFAVVGRSVSKGYEKLKTNENYQQAVQSVQQGSKSVKNADLYSTVKTHPVTTTLKKAAVQTGKGTAKIGKKLQEGTMTAMTSLTQTAYKPASEEEIKKREIATLKAEYKAKKKEDKKIQKEESGASSPSLFSRIAGMTVAMTGKGKSTPPAEPSEANSEASEPSQPPAVQTAASPASTPSYATPSYSTPSYGSKPSTPQQATPEVEPSE